MNRKRWEGEASGTHHAKASIEWRVSSTAGQTVSGAFVDENVVEPAVRYDRV